jgi:hsp70-interacting protein
MWFVYSDLDKLGGLLPVIRELSNENEEIRTTSVWVLGTASQNNALVQDQVMPFTIHE